MQATYNKLFTGRFIRFKFAEHKKSIRKVFIEIGRLTIIFIELVMKLWAVGTQYTLHTLTVATCFVCTHNTRAQIQFQLQASADHPIANFRNIRTLFHHLVPLTF